MKALSLKQPWAELILSGKKTIETRTWNTTFRGEFLIHASARVDQAAMKHFGFEKGSLSTSCIVGQATIMNVIKYPSKAAFLRDKEKHLVWRVADAKPRFGYTLRDARRVRLYPCKGRLHFFAIELP
jgi:hypothetical protein